MKKIISPSEIAEIKKIPAYEKESVETRVLNSCQIAFHMGETQKEKTRLTTTELFEKVDSVLGYYEKVIWEAYKAGIWTRDND